MPGESSHRVAQSGNLVSTCNICFARFTEIDLTKPAAFLLLSGCRQDQMRLSSTARPLAWALSPATLPSLSAGLSC